MIRIRIDGRPFEVHEGISVAAALARCGVMRFRRSVSGEARAPLCGMGVCMECRVTVGDARHVRSCQVLCVDGMEIRTGD